MSALSFAAFCAELALGYAMSHPAPFFVALGVAGAAGVFGIAARFMARDDMPLTFAEQETVDVFAGMTAELHHELAAPAAPALVEHAHARHARPGPLRRAAGRLAEWWHGLRQSAPEMPPAPERIDAWVATLRPRTWAVDALAGQIHALPAAPARLALPAPPAGDGPAPVRAVTASPSPAVLGETPGSGPAAGVGTTECPSCGGPRDECWYAPGGTGGPVTCPDDWHDDDARHPGDHLLTTDVPGRAPATAHTPGSPPSPAHEGSGAGPAGDPRWPWLDRPWADDTGSFAAICREGT